MVCTPTLTWGFGVLVFFPAANARSHRRAKYSCSVPAVFAQKTAILSISEEAMNFWSGATSNEGGKGSTKRMSWGARLGRADSSSCRKSLERA